VVELPPIPPKIAKLRLDRRGYPVPWFVQWMKGIQPTEAGEIGAEPDFRIISGEKRVRAYTTGLCWICGEQMGAHRIFPIGPMCLINLTTQEPPCHRACAEYAVQACPFLTQPRRRRNGEGLPEGATADGEMIERNPGVTALVEAKSYFRFNDDEGGWLIKLVEPIRVDWWAHGRQAMRKEVKVSIDSGLPLLSRLAMAEGEEAMDELARLTGKAMRWMPAA
jgi:hypothetical protein